MTSSTVMGLPSWKRASGRSVKATHERSGGVSMVSATRPYSDDGSSADATMSESNVLPMPAAGTPLKMNGLRLSNVPVAARVTLPPLGARGFTYPKWAKPGPYLRSPWMDSPCAGREGGAGRGQAGVAVAVRATARTTASAFIPNNLLIVPAGGRAGSYAAVWLERHVELAVLLPERIPFEPFFGVADRPAGLEV